jgi:hypothetical protein
VTQLFLGDRERSDLDRQTIRFFARWSMVLSENNVVKSDNYALYGGTAYLGVAQELPLQDGCLGEIV